MRNVEILLQTDLSELAASKAWNDLVNGEENITLLAYTALQVETRRPGVIPGELLESLSRKIVPGCLRDQCAITFPHLSYTEPCTGEVSQAPVAVHRARRYAVGRHLTSSDPGEAIRSVLRRFNVSMTGLSLMIRRQKEASNPILLLCSFLTRTGTLQCAKPVSSPLSMRHHPSLGEAIVLIDQPPSLISVPARGNTYTTIAMNVKHRSDVNALAGAMRMDEETREVFGRLPIGTAVIKLQGRWIQPFLVQIPPRKPLG